MSPLFSQDDPRNGGLAGPEPQADGFLTDAASRIQFPYLPDVVLRQVGHVMAFATRSMFYDRNDIPSFADFVSHVVGVSSQEQMAWPNAGWAVALVAYDQSVGDWSEMQLPGKTMGAEVLPVGQHFAVAAASGVLIDPAGLSLLDTLPEPFLGSAHPSGVGAWTTTEPSLTAPILNRARVKHLATGRAVDGDAVFSHTLNVSQSGGDLQHKKVTS